MACQVLPYAVEYYNSLPELRVVKDRFESAQASKILFMEIGKVFVKHHVEDTLGIALLYNHFLLEQHEMLVNINSVVVPWDVQAARWSSPVSIPAPGASPIRALRHTSSPTRL